MEYEAGAAMGVRPVSGCLHSRIAMRPDQLGEQNYQRDDGRVFLTISTNPPWGHRLQPPAVTQYARIEVQPGPIPGAYNSQTPRAAGASR